MSDSIAIIWRAHVATRGSPGRDTGQTARHVGGGIVDPALCKLRHLRGVVASDPPPQDAMLPSLLALWLSTPASASGILRPPVHHRLDAACAVTHAPQSPAEPLRYQGYQVGVSAPPGGPSTTHLFAAPPDALTLRRQGCAEHEPGAFGSTGATCGPAPVLEWRGELLPGATYVIRGNGSDLLHFSTQGEPTGAPCPAPATPADGA